MYANVQVRGAHFRGMDIRNLSDSLVVGTVLTLEREPDNEHDPYAIKVFFQDHHIGYIQRDIAAYMAPDMDEGAEFSVVITGREAAGRASYPIVDCEEIDLIEIENTDIEPGE